MLLKVRKKTIESQELAVIQGLLNIKAFHFTCLNKKWQDTITYFIYAARVSLSITYTNVMVFLYISPGLW